MELKAKLSIEQLQSAKNINDLLSEEDSEKIGNTVFEGYETDKRSRAGWERKTKSALELAQQITKEKSTPWRNASNVKFPLLTIAALQFASRAYPSLVKAPDLVKFRVQGADPGGAKSGRALRVSSHMSYQLLEEDEGWEEGQDRAFIALPILGCVFKKTYRDNTKNCSKLVLPDSLIVNYYATSLEDAERVTEILPKMSMRKYLELVAREEYSKVDFFGSGNKGDNDNRKVSDKRQGIVEPPGDAPRQPLEQHRYLDLDGDGYEEPYIVTIDKDTRKVLRIVASFEKIISKQSIEIERIDEQILQIAISLQPPQEQPTPEQVAQAKDAANALEVLEARKQELLAETPDVLEIVPGKYYTKYSFIPSPDGGFYDLGFGALLSPLNSSVDTLINQLIDSGTLQNGSVGFIGKGARIKGGKLAFSPNEWKKVDVVGGALRENLVPLPINQPSGVLFNLLGLLIQYTERIASVNDATVGENPGQNPPAYNMSAMLEQGLQIFNAIFKRCYRSFRSEIRKLYKLNAAFLGPKEYFEFQDRGMEVFQSDYLSDPKDLIPAADPNAFSDKERQQKAMIIAERARMTPGYDPIKVEQRFLEAMDIPNAAEVFPIAQAEDGSMQLVFQPSENPDLTIKKMEEARRSAEGQVRLQIQWQQAMADIALKEAQIVEVHARAEKTADSMDLDRLKILQREVAEQRAALSQKAQTEEQEQQQNDPEGTDTGMGGEPSDRGAAQALSGE